MDQYLKKGHEYLAFGKVNMYNGMPNMVHPEMENIAEDFDPSKLAGLEPVYASTEKLNKRGLDTKLRRRLLAAELPRVQPDDIPEILPEYMVSKLRLCSRYEAYRWIHFPNDTQQLQKAEVRFKYEEIFLLQMKLILNKKYNQQMLKGAVLSKVGEKFNYFFSNVLPFELTGAQKRVLKEIRKDVVTGIQMNRLLQGDVGSGKTIVAFMSMLLAIDNGYQACMMAPTEILAQQHYASIKDLAKDMDITVGFLSGSVKGKRRAEILVALKDGHIDILLGTHALIEDWVVFDDLGLVVIDEQHRFGVAQRARLWKKNTIAPHILIMSATPIPRTLSMTVYGDLDVSVIDELPPGRKEIKTIHSREKDRMRIVEFLRTEIAKGRQIYIVFPLIEESEALDLADLQRGYDEIQEYFPMPKYQISMVHGKMKPKDKDMEMERFASGKTQIMVATTVIEVGVNVPNASVMIIENAERFGLSQLHQLRGRVGRGAEQSYCILMTGYKLSQEARFRLKTMVDTNDGFKIAEADLELRGPGDIAGTRQSGDMAFRKYNMLQDTQYLEVARKYALLIGEKDPKLEHPAHLILRRYLKSRGIAGNVWGRIS